MSVTSTPRPIFRPEVVRRFTERQERAVLPRFIRPRTFLCLWLLVTLLGVATFSAWRVEVPERLSGSAVIVVRPNGVPEIIGLFPADARSRLEAGQEFTVRLPGHDGKVRGEIERVETDVLSPAEAASRLELDGPDATIPGNMGPLVMIAAPFSLEGSALATKSFVGVEGQIDVITGSHRVIEMVLPAGLATADKDPQR